MTYEQFKKEITNTELSSEEFYNEMKKKLNINVLNNYYEKYLLDIKDDEQYNKVEYYIDNKNMDLTYDSYYEDTYKNYLKEISRIPNLSKEERMSILKKIHDLDEKLKQENITKEEITKELKSINYKIQGFNCNLLKKCINDIDSDDNKKIVNKIKKYYIYEELVEKFMEHNLKLVVRVAIATISQKTNQNIQILDLIQNGNMGLRRAIEKYDVNSGYQFSTYAFTWIRNFIGRGICAEENMITLPIHLYSDYRRLLQAEQEFKEKYKRQPSNKELAKILGFYEERIPQIRNSMNKVASLDEKLNEEDDTTLADMIPDENCDIEKDIDTFTEEQEVYDLISSAKIRYKEKIILVLRFGLDLRKYVDKSIFVSEFIQNKSKEELIKIYNDLCNNSAPLTLNDIGKIFGVTRERIRQLEAKAIKRVKIAALKKGLMKAPGLRRYK